MNVLVRISLAVLLVYLDSQALFWFLEKGSLSGPLISHLLLVIGGVLLILKSLPSSEIERGKVVLFLIPLMALIPVFGPALSLGIIILGSPRQDSNMRSRRYVPLTELLPEGLGEHYSFGTTISSIAEIMRGHNAQTRRQATLALKNLKPADSLPILRRLTQDDDEIVRLFALGERRRITSEFEVRSRRLARKRKDKSATVRELLALAENYLQEVEVGLPADELQRDALLKKAQATLWEARRRDPERVDIEFDILRCALAGFDIDVATRSFHRLRSSDAFKNRLTLQQCEFHFQTGAWRELANELFMLPESYRQSPQFERVLSLWDPAIRRLVGAKAI